MDFFTKCRGQFCNFNLVGRYFIMVAFWSYLVCQWGPSFWLCPPAHSLFPYPTPCDFPHLSLFFSLSSLFAPSPPSSTTHICIHTYNNNDHHLMTFPDMTLNLGHDRGVPMLRQRLPYFSLSSLTSFSTSHTRVRF